MITKAEEPAKEVWDNLQVFIGEDRSKEGCCSLSSMVFLACLLRRARYEMVGYR